MLSVKARRIKVSFRRGSMRCTLMTDRGKVRIIGGGCGLPQCFGERLHRLALLEGGHLLHPGSVSLGCITFRADSDLRRQQYTNIHNLLNSERGRNWLIVTQ